MMTDIEIAQAANPLKIGEIAQAAGVDEKYSSRRRKDHDHGRSGRRIETSWQKGNRSAS